MIEEFKNLTQEEVEVMIKTPVLVSILIAGADDDIDRNEINKAVSLSKSKQTGARPDLIEYYRVTGKDFETRLNAAINSYPSDAAERNPLIIAELEKLNHILPKLDPNFAAEFYFSIRDAAKKIAESSGGLLGYMAIGYEESKLIDLHMIKNPAQ